MTQEVKTKLEEMNLVDQFLFNEVAEYQDAFEAVVSILLGKEIKLFGKTETEKEFRVSPQLREVRLDSVGVDVNHKVYMVEMQKRDTRNLRKRGRNSRRSFWILWGISRTQQIDLLRRLRANG